MSDILALSSSWKIATMAKQGGRKLTNFSVFSGSVEDFPTTFYLLWQTHKTSQMIDRNIRNYLDRVRKSINCMKNKNSKTWWNLILWTTSLTGTWPKVFSQKLVWSGEIHYTNIVVLDLFWRWEVKLRFLRNDAYHCIFIRLHGNIFQTSKSATCLTSYQRKPRGGQAFRLPSRTIDKSSARRMIL